ncbi:Transmembrane protein [Sesbania bispinosa]|nr:Transmembrane protein [Sesbania bispinosa]
MMFLIRLWCFACLLFVLVGLRLEVANAQFYRKVGNKVLPYWTIFVDPSGHGNFSTIQSAIDSVPSNNKYWVSIKVKAGTYREKVNIPVDKPYIILKGEGKRRTLVEWDDHDTTSESPTFSIMADNIVVKSMSFRNSYNNPINNKPKVPAVAAMVSGDKSYFFRVGFFGLQDTLWDDRGRHYYKLCTIQGAIDFIFGAGQSLFERCSISVIGGALDPGLPGFITAQGRVNPKDSSGFVFKDCHVFGNGTTYLGRPWRGYSRVLFYKTNMSHIVQPTGWDAWNFLGHEDRITFAEYGNFGGGADTSKRELKSAMEEHVELMADLVQKFSSELRAGLGPALDNFMGFFHAIDWKVTLHPFSFFFFVAVKCENQYLFVLFVLPSPWIPFFSTEERRGEEKGEPWLMGLLAFHVGLLLVAIISRKNTNFQMFLFLLTLAGVYLAERLNSFLGKNWKSFSGQNYFDPSGLFMSVLWSGPLLVIAMIILINTLFSLCYLIVRWKRAELRHRARAARSKQD